MANTGLAGMGNNEDEEFNAAISALKSLCDGRPLPPPADVIKLVPKSNLNATNTQGRSLVNLTARAGDEDVLRALIHAGADVNMCDQFGISALMLAANWGWTRSVEILLKAKADTTAAERSTGSSSPLHPGRNALMAAADRDHEKIVRLLLDHNVDVMARDELGRNALDVAGPKSTILLVKDGAYDDVLQAVECTIRASEGLQVDAVQRTRTDIAKGEVLAEAARAAQRVAAALLERQGSYNQWILLHEERGEAVLQEALKLNFKIFLGRPRVQELLYSRWRGEVYSYLNWFDETGSQERNPNKYYFLKAKLVLAIPFNLLFMPIAAAIPPLHEWIKGQGHLARHSSQLDTKDTHSWADFYLLRVPAFAWTIRCVCNMLFVILLTLSYRGIEGTDPEADGLIASVAGRAGLLLWSLSMIAVQLFTICTTDIGFWLDDPLNIVEMVGSFSATTALVRIGGGGQSEGPIGLALICLWTEPLLRLASLSDAIGPLVLMLEDMLYDLFRWALLAACLIVGVAASLFALFRSEVSHLGCMQEDHSLFDPPALADAPPAHFGFGRNFITLIENALSFTMPRKCLEESTQAIGATTIYMYYELFINILMINALIAMMAKTFDRIHGQLALNYQFMFARRSVLAFQAIQSELVLIPPVTLLAVPYMLLEVVATRVWLIWQRRCPCAHEAQHQGPEDQRLSSSRSTMGIRSFSDASWKRIGDEEFDEDGRARCVDPTAASFSDSRFASPSASRTASRTASHTASRRVGWKSSTRFVNTSTLSLPAPQMALPPAQRDAPSVEDLVARMEAPKAQGAGAGGAPVTLARFEALESKVDLLLSKLDGMSPFAA